MGEKNQAALVAASYHHSLYHYALALSRQNRQEALGIVQQTYLEVLEGRADLDKAADERAFLFGVARRVAASRRRRRSIFHRLLGLNLVEPEQPSIPHPEDASQKEQQATRVRAALKKLPVRQLEVTTLVFMEDLTIEEAAAAMGISLGSARTHYHRAKKKLSTLLKKELGHV